MIKGTKRLEDLGVEEVRFLQRELGVEIDGILGPITRKAWHEFKERNYLGELDLIGDSSIKILLEQNKEIDWTDFSSNVGKYFTVGEVSLYDRERIVNNSLHRENVIKLAKELDKIREIFGPIKITSWYRPPNVNRRVGGVSNSQHLYGLAADIITLEKDLIYVENYLDKYWQGRLGRGAKNPKRRFIHLDLGTEGMSIPPIGLVQNKVDNNKVVRWDY